MVDSILRIQQLMAESRFVEAQNEAEIQLNLIKGSETIELIEIYFQTLEAQGKQLSAELLLVLIEKCLPDKIQKARTWLERLDKINHKNKQKILLIKIQIAESLGKTEALYQLVSEYQVNCYENNYPVVNEYVEKISKKYFSDDFQITLQKLALTLLRLDLKEADVICKNLILSCFEKANSRGKTDRLQSIADVLSGVERIYHLDLYRTFCLIMAKGIQEKKDLKKVIELVIYFEDIRLQAIILSFFKEKGMDQIAEIYALEVSKNKDFNFLYFEKYFPNCKQYFLKTKKNEELIKKEEIKIDLKLTEEIPKIIFENIENEISNEELVLVSVLKYNNLTANELVELAVSFLQSDYYMAGLKAADLANNLATENKMKLKATYLQISCLLKLGDNRAVLDRSIEALKISETENDFLSFLYCRAEALIKLYHTKEAKSVLKQILKIDQNYRLAKERLERLDAI